MFPFDRVQNPTTRRLLYFGSGAVVLAIVVVAAIIVITLLRSDDPALAETAPPIPTAAAGARKSNIPSGSILHFVVDKGSSAKYVAREQLSIAPVPSNAVGTTKDVTGDLYLTKAGLAQGQKSGFKVDMRTITSDESLRDRAMRGPTALGTDRFPFAEFVIESVTGFPTDYSPDREVQVTLSGSLTLKEATKPVTWMVHARSSGD